MYIINLHDNCHEGEKTLITEKMFPLTSTQNMMAI